MYTIAIIFFWGNVCNLSEYLMSGFDSAVDGWLNPPLRFHDEPCRHKVLDLIGDLSLLAQDGNQGLPVAHIVAYKVSNMSLIFSQF